MTALPVSLSLTHERGHPDATVRRPHDAQEAALVARAQAGEHSAFETIFNQYQKPLYNYIYRLMGSHDDAADLTQDTFLKAYLALPKTSDDLRVSGWLFRIATNVCLDELRHRQLVKWLPWTTFISVPHPSQIAKENPEHDCIDRENRHEVQAILDRLTPRHRAVMILREYHDLSYDEIGDLLIGAAETPLPRSTVKSILLRARDAFRAAYVAAGERRPGRVSGGTYAVEDPYARLGQTEPVAGRQRPTMPGTDPDACRLCGARLPGRRTDNGYERRWCSKVCANRAQKLTRQGRLTMPPNPHQVGAPAGGAAGGAA